MKRLAIVALSLVLAGCVLPGCAMFKGLQNDVESVMPMTTDGALATFKPIQNSAAAPCTMQKEVAAHNSVHATLKEKKETVYKAPCEVDAPKKAPTSTPAKKPAAVKAVS